jgi:hypothetical protein
MKYFEISQLKSGSKNLNVRAQEGWSKRIFLFSPFQKAAASPTGHGVGSGSPLRQQGSKVRKNCFLNCPALYAAGT